MNNNIENTASPIQQPPVDQSSNNDEEEVITRLTLAGLEVLMVRKRDQIIYKLPDNMQVASIKEEQRQKLMEEIQALHQETMKRAAEAQQIQQQQQLNQQSTSDVKPIAPKHEQPSLDTPPQPTAAEADAIKETARKLREELEQQQFQMKQQQQQQQMYPYDSNPSSPYDSSKTTRRYNKTGKYSKKKQQQLQQFPFLQQQQLSQQQLLALQQSLQSNGVNNINTMMLNSSTPTTPMTTSATSTPSTPNTAFPFPPLQQQQIQQLDNSMKSSPAPTPPPATPASQRPITQQNPAPSQADTILAKRLPEEELQHREVKKRCFDSLLSDQKAVTSPDYETPFTSIKDAMERLLPYHIYQYPKGDLDANKIPLDRQDHTMIEIFKCQVELFDRYAAIVKKVEENRGNMSIKVFIHRQVMAEQRQKLTEEQVRVVAEQSAQQQELLRIQTEKARLAAVAEQEARQQQQQQQQLQQHLQQQQIQQQQLSQMHQQLQPNQIQPQQLQQLQPQQLQQLMQQMSAQQAMSQLEQYQMQQQQQQQQQNPAAAQVNAANYANGLAQASALLTNPQFQSQYSQLPPELQERLQKNREQLVALLEKQQQNNNNNQQS